MQQVIKTFISSEEFTKRYEERIIPNNLYIKYWDQSVFMGTIINNKFYFYWKPAHIRNSFNTILKGSIVENREGCNIEYKFDKFTSTKISTIIFSSCLIIIGFILLINLELIFLIPFAMSLLSIIPAVLKTKRSKEILIKQLLKIVETSYF